MTRCVVTTRWRYAEFVSNKKNDEKQKSANIVFFMTHDVFVINDLLPSKLNWVLGKHHTSASSHVWCTAAHSLGHSCGKCVPSRLLFAWYVCIGFGCTRQKISAVNWLWANIIIASYSQIANDCERQNNQLNGIRRLCVWVSVCDKTMAKISNRLWPCLACFDSQFMSEV